MARAAAEHVATEIYDAIRQNVATKGDLREAERRKALLWAVERRLAEDGARPIIFYNRAGTCWQPYVKGLTIWSTAFTTRTATKTSGLTSSRYRQTRPVELGPTSNLASH
jgi:hypothetical protein